MQIASVLYFSKLPKVLQLLLLVVIFSLVFIGISGQKASASCFTAPIDEANVGGTIYRTVELRSSEAGSTVGLTLLEDCGVSMQHPTAGLRADRLWIGTSAGGLWNARAPAGMVTDVPPDTGFGVMEEDLSGTYGVFQDDAAFIAVNGYMVHCSGFAPSTWSGDPGIANCSHRGDAPINVYDGYPTRQSGCNIAKPSWPVVNNCWALRGAGYVFHDDELTGYFGSTGGRLNDGTITFGKRNTYPFGHTVNIRLTFRYPPDIPPAPGNILGRVFIDNNGNDSWEPWLGEQLTQNPPGQCGAYADIPINIEVLDVVGQKDVSNCSPPEPYFIFNGVPTGLHRIELRNIPPGWRDTTGSRVVFVPSGGEVHQWFGIQPTGTILGRVFVDENGNGSFDPPEEMLIQNPPGQCGGYANVPVRVDIVNVTQADLSNCGPGGGPEPYYLAQNVPIGSQTVRVVNLPPGWQDITGPQTVTVNQSADTHVWFGIRLQPPTVTTQCSNGTITGDVSWSPSGIGTTDYYIDIDNDTDWNNGLSNKKELDDGTLTTPIPGGLDPPITLNPSTQYWARVYYWNYGFHSGTQPFTTQGACYGFTIDATGSVSLNDEENPTSVAFGTGFRIIYTPAGGSGVNLNVRREFFTKLVSNPGFENQIGPSPLINNGFYNPPGNNQTFPIVTTGLGGLNPGDQVCVRVIVDPGSGIVDGAGNVTNPGPAEIFEECKTITNKPYFRIYNSDILSGLGGACNGWTTGATPSNLIGYNDGSGKGSGTQLAAFAADQILEFSSATGRPASPSPAPYPPRGLSFANNDLSKPFGGSFGAGSCPDDYYAKSGGADNTTNSPVIQSGAGLPNGSTKKSPSGNVTLNQANGLGAIEVKKNEKKVLYVEGDVFIQNNVVYEMPWSTVTEIPNFTLVVKGNIYINKDVDRLDGTFIAQPNGAAGGEIHTCTTGFATPTQADIINNCDDKQLTINGAFIAKRVRFQRSIGSLRNSSNGDNRSSGMPAERFIFGPDSWLSSPLDPDTGASEFDSITSAPTVL